MSECLTCKYRRLFWKQTSWASLFSTWGSDTGVLSDGSTYEVISRKTDTRENSYGEYNQGSEAEINFVVKVNAGYDGNLFFKMTGTADSYGEERWDGEFVQVFPTEKTTIVYTYEEA